MTKRVDHRETVVCDWCGTTTEATPTMVNTSEGGVLHAAPPPWVTLNPPYNFHNVPFGTATGTDLCGECAAAYTQAIGEARQLRRERAEPARISPDATGEPSAAETGETRASG